MLDPDPPFQPIRRTGGYLPLEDFGLIGDGAAAALVGRDGSIPWLCAPRFDSPPVFAGLLDHARGGAFAFAPDEPFEARQSYRPDTAVLDTESRCASGTVRITDAMTLRSGADLSDDMPCARGELVRSALVLSGRVRLRYAVEPRGGARVRPLFSGVELILPAHPGLRLHLRADRRLGGAERTGGMDGTHGVFELAQGESVSLSLSWARAHRHHRFEAAAILLGTERAWHRWMSGFDYQGPQEAMVRRSAVTLKLCDDWSDGALVAAPTASLPAPVGGVRNWDYRYAWIRDAALAVSALRRIGFGIEADAFLGWVLDAFEACDRPRIMYTLTGRPVPDEVVDEGLEGYRGSGPVRFGNGATGQVQHDVYGEVLDCAYQWVEGGGEVPAPLWDALARLADQAGRQWRTPDQGIWEVRGPGRVFTYSAALCQVALDRAARIGRLRGAGEAAAAWRDGAERLRELILREAWDERARSLTQRIGPGGGLDASLLALPLRRVLPFDHPRMVATAAAVAERLSAGGGLLYRYLPAESPDGLPGEEGAFVLCSFWLVENLAGQGRVEEAAELYASLCGRAGPLGLLAEQIDPTTGASRGNFPQVLSHIGVVSAGVALGRALAGPGPGGRR